VDRAADPVALQVHHLQALGHDAEPDEGGVAVHQHRHHPAALGVALLVLLRPDLAHHDRVDRLEVRGVRGQRQVHRLPVGSWRSVEVPRWYFTSPEPSTSSSAALPWNSDRIAGVGLAHDVGEHVEPAAVRHAQHDLLHAQAGRGADDRLERRDRALAAVQAEALGARELDVEELLEALGLGEVLQDLALLLRLGGVEPVRALDPGLDPGLLLRVLDVQELDADRAGVGLAQDLDDLAERGLLQAEHVVEVELAAQVGVGEAVGAVVELGVVRVAGEAQRVELRQQVAAHPVGADQHDDPEVVAQQRLRGRVVDAAPPTSAAPAGSRWRPPAAARPRGAGLEGRPGALEQRAVLGLQLVEVGPPAGVDPGRVGQVAGVELLDEGAVAAVEERGLLELASRRHDQ
jgi:hypothetical protein